MFTHDMLTMAVSNRMLIHTMFMGATIFDRVASGSEPSELELRLTTQSISLLRQEVAINVMREVVVWPIVVFCFICSEQPLRIGKLPNRTPVLRELQSLHIIGRFATNKVHERALVGLLHALGGLGRLQTTGMAGVILL
jgi:hypothetical protein